MLGIVFKPSNWFAKSCLRKNSLKQHYTAQHDNDLCCNKSPLMPARDSCLDVSAPCHRWPAVAGYNGVVEGPPYQHGQTVFQRCFVSLHEFGTFQLGATAPPTAEDTHNFSNCFWQSIAMLKNVGPC